MSVPTKRSRSKWRKARLPIVLALVLTACGQAIAQASGTEQASGPGSFVVVEGSKLYYEECGTGAEAVVLIHDGIVHSAVWDDVWPDFCKHFHTIRYDRRGYGRTPAATTWYTETEDLVALLRQ